jgi:hypothetical protein
VRPKKDVRAADVLARATTLLKRHQVAGLIQVTASETAITRRRSGKRVRPAADTPTIAETQWQVAITVQRNESAIAQEERMAGWRVSVTNTPPERLTHA